MKFYIILILLGSFNLCLAQWVEIYNFPDNGFNNLYFFDESEGIVLQDDKIYKTYDSGESWSLIDSYPSGYFFWHMDFYGDTGIIVGSMPNQGLYTNDRGEHWVGLIPADISYHNIDLLNGREYYKTPITDPHFVYCNLEIGICQDTLIAFGILLMHDIEIIDADTIYVCSSSPGPSSGLYKTINGGLDWQPMEVDVLAFLDFPSSKTGYGVALDYVVKTSNYGNDWNQIILADSISAIGNPFFLSEEFGFAVYESVNGNSGILKTTDGLATSTLTPFPSEEMIFNSDGINSLFCRDELNCWCITNYGKVYRTSNGGEGGVIVTTNVSQYQNTTNEFWSYPNPTSNVINVHLTLNQISDLNLYDIFGRIYDLNILEYNDNFLTIDISTLSKGVYYLTLKNNLTTCKIVKM